MDFLDDHPGSPLGLGMPSGSPLRDDGQSHLEGWAAIVRRDPCSYCDGPGGTLDHIVPRNARVPVPLGGKHGWLNFTAACERCNAHKGSLSLLDFLDGRVGHRRLCSDRIAA